MVQGLLTLIVPPTKIAVVALFTDCVDLIDEDDTRGFFIGFLEQVADFCGAASDEHLDEFGAGNTEERHIGFAGNSAGQQGFTRSGRSDQQDALRILGTDILVFFRLMQVIDDFAERFFGFVLSGDILECLGVVCFHVDFGIRFAERQCATGTAAHPFRHLFPKHAAQSPEQQER